MSQNNDTTSRSTLSMSDLNRTKKTSLKLAAHLKTLHERTGDQRYLSQATRVHYCSTFWQGFYCEKCGKFHHMHTTGCRHRLCPTCAVRASRVVAVQAMEALEHIRIVLPDISCSLLTLTQRNVPGESLNGEIDAVLKAWQALRHLRPFGRHVLGWARTIEIIPALDGRGYHPHIHAIIIHRNLGPLSHPGWWSQSWRECMKLDYNPIVDIRPIEEERGAIYEVSKYISKMSRIYVGGERELENVQWIGDAMHQRQLRTYGGCWLKARRVLNQLRVEQLSDDELSEYGEALDTRGACVDCETPLKAVCLSWAGLTYVFDDGVPASGLKVGDLRD